MLTSLFIFSLKASLVLAMLYLAYHVLFKRNTHFGIRRVLLLGIVLAALALPTMQFKTQMSILPSTPVVQQVDALPYVEQLEVIIDEERYQKAADELAYEPVEDLVTNIQRGQLNVVDMAAIVYLAGIVVMLCMLLFEMCRILWLAVFGPSRHDLDRHIIAHKWIKTPFSFAKWIFIPDDSAYDDDTWKLIKWHEQVHLNQAHSIDVLISAMIRCFMWYNPAVHLLHKEIKDNHESLADQSILKRVNLATYSEALLKVSLQTGSLNLGHGFALKSNLIKRIQTMQSNRTTLIKSFTAIMLFAVIGLGIFTQTSLYSQKSKMIRPTRADFMSGKFTLPIGYTTITPRHKMVMDKLKNIYPDKELSWQYMDESKPEMYNDMFFAYRKTEYFGKLTKDDKEALINEVMSDSLRLDRFRESYSLTMDDVKVLATKNIENRLNYFVIYEPLYPEEGSNHDRVYEMDAVDASPIPIGGLEAFERAVALDAELPEGINRADLPETVEFSFIVYGGNRISHLNLETELKGNRKTNQPIYRFFGSVHNNLKSKIQSFYSWQKGIKDGEKVNVRMVVSIPTKYM